MGTEKKDKLNDNAWACFEHGQIFEFGSKVPNLKSAVLAYRQAAKAGNSTAQYFLALAYLMGDGVKKNRRVAVAWFRRAVEGGEDLCNFLSTRQDLSKEALIAEFCSLAAD